MNNIRNSLITAAYSFSHPLTKTLSIVAGLFFAVFLVVLAVFWAPAYGTYSSAANEIRAAKDLMNSVRESQQVSEAYKKTVEQAAVIEKKLRYSGTAGSVTSALNALAGKNSISLSIDNSSDAQKGVPGYAVDIHEVTLTGGYQNLRSFISGIEKMDSLTVIRKIKVDNGAKAGSGIKAWMTLATYRSLRSGGGRQ